MECKPTNVENYELSFRYMIDYIETKSAGELPDWRGFTLASLFFVSGMAHSFTFSQAIFRMMRCGLEIKISLIGLIYQKVR